MAFFNLSKTFVVRTISVLAFLSLSAAFFMVSALGGYTDVLRVTPSALQVISDDSLPPEVKASEANTVHHLFDRDTHTEFTAFGTSQIIVDLPKPKVMRGIKVFGAAPYRITVEAKNGSSWQTLPGLSSVDLSSQTPMWHSLETTNPLTTQQLRVTLSPSSGGSASGLRELEIWAEGANYAVNSERTLLEKMQGNTPLAQGLLYDALPGQGLIGNVSGNPDDPTDNTFTFTLDRNPATFKRVWLSYEVTGAGHWISAVRSINGHTAQGGVYRFASTSWSSQMELINPELLQQGDNTISFSVPDDKQSYALRNVQLLVQLDNGSNFVTQVVALPESASSAAKATQDNDSSTGWRPFDSTLSYNGVPQIEMYFDRPVQLDTVRMNLVNTLEGKIEVEFLKDGQWVTSGLGAILGQKLETGWNALGVHSNDPITAVRLKFVNGSGSSADILELVPVGSGVGGSQGSPQVVLTYPDGGQYYGDQALVRGFVYPFDNGSGHARLLIGANEIPLDETGGFEALINISGAIQTPEGYEFTLDVIYPDQGTFAQKLVLTSYGDVNLVNQQMYTTTHALESDATDADPVPVNSVPLNEDEMIRIEVDEGALELRRRALKDGDPNKLTITSLRNGQDLPPLNPGMTNVTKGPRHGYRFGPHGSKFKENIHVEIPYDEKKLPAGMSPDDVRTYYYDVELNRWVPLERITVDKTNKKVISNTDHFTDMINATVVVPDSPNAASFNGNTIKDIKAADPGSKINLIEVPQANNNGDANLKYPIEVPPGRAGLQPQLALSYSSAGGSGWAGQGWDISVPSITIDTRWGVPRYDEDNETETYTFNGQMLIPVADSGETLPPAHRGGVVPRKTNREFKPRIEGAFNKIIRHGNAPKNYWWEVIDKKGTRFIYGAAQNTKNALLKDSMMAGPKGIAVWKLSKVIDTHGNTMTYFYDLCDDSGNNGKATCVSGAAELPINSARSGQQQYLKEIHYTGHGDDDTGAYRVIFNRDTKPRKDVRIDARFGFKSISTYLLKSIEVQIYNPQMDRIRHYELEYVEGAFRKSLLSKVTQFDSDEEAFNAHNFSYYDELERTTGGFKGFASGIDVETGDEDLSMKVGPSRFSNSMLGGTQGHNEGYSGYVGIGPGPTKKISGGKGFNRNTSTSESYIALVDIDGDGKADKVFREGTGVYYRKNESMPGSSVIKYSDEKIEVVGLNKISYTQSTSNGGGPQGYLFGVSGSDGSSHTTTITSVYFTDVNGDGLVDLVDRGVVYFNTVVNGKRTFVVDSSLSASPINGSAIDPSILPDFTKLKQQDERENPLMDAVRRWEAPYAGTIRIRGDVTLVDSRTEREELGYEDADGVRVSIQKNGDKIWDKTISAEGPGFTRTVNLTRQVSKGDRIYFRVNSIYNGDYDQVQWSPVIEYVDGSGNARERFDVNGMNEYRYSASEDTVFAGRDIAINVPYKGKLKFTGTINKSKVTTDDIRFVITRLSNEETFVNGKRTIKTTRIKERERTIAWSDTGNIDLDYEFDVNDGDSVEIKFFVDSAIDMQSLKWVKNPVTGHNIPKLYYIEAYKKVADTLPEPGTVAEGEKSTEEIEANLQTQVDNLDVGYHYEEITPIQKGGEYLYQLDISTSADTYTLDLEVNGPQQAWTATNTGIVYVTPLLSLKTYSDDDGGLRQPKAINADVYLTVKRQNQKGSKQKISIVNGHAGDGNGLDGVQMLHVTAGEKYYFDFNTRNGELGSEIDERKVFISYASTKRWSVPFDGTVRVDTSFSHYFSGTGFFYYYPENEYDDLLFVVSDGNEILYKKVYRGQPNDDSNGGYLSYQESFNLNVIQGQSLRYDFISISRRSSVTGQSVTASYSTQPQFADTGSAEYMLVQPDLRFHDNAKADGNLRVIARTGNNSKIGDKTFEFSNGQLSSAPSLIVPAGNGLKFEFLTDDYAFSSQFQDIGGVSMIPMKVTEWRSTGSNFGSDYSLLLKPILDLNPNTETGYIELLVLRDGKLDIRKRYEVVNGIITQPIENITLQSVSLGEALQFVYLASSEQVQQAINQAQLSVYLAEKQLAQLDIETTSDEFSQQAYRLQIKQPQQYKEQDEITSVAFYHQPHTPLYGNPYRGWSYFAYNANGGRAINPIDESRLTVSSNENDYKNGSAGLPIYLAYPNLTTQRWQSEDDKWWISSTAMSSSRRGMDNISYPDPTDLQGGAGVVMRVSQISETDTDTSGGGFIISYNSSSGNNSGTLTMMDMNGDRYPDIVGANSIQYSKGDGALQSASEGFGATRSSIEENHSYTLGLSDSEGCPASDGKKDPSCNKDDSPRATPGFSGSFGGSSSSVAFDLMDMNGDGLPDRVFQNGSIIEVSLNLGYSFAPKVEWGTAVINQSTGNSQSFGVSIGYGDAENSISGGLNLSRSNNYGTQALMDMNGDGLPDRIYTQGKNIYVGFNNGAGFQQAVKWEGALSTFKVIADPDEVESGQRLDGTAYISDGSSTSGSINASGSFYISPFLFIPFHIHVTAGGNLGDTVSRPTLAYRDIDGDGLIDSVRSASENHMTVALNKTGRTNMLKAVHRPLGASFEIEYERVNSTPEMPQSKWVMKQVTVLDGHEGDGADVQVMSFDYLDGYQDRYERDFLGFATVITNQHDTLKSGYPVYRRTVAQYLNDSIYSKGIAVSQRIENADGAVYRETVNTIALVDTRTQDPFAIADGEWDDGSHVVFPQQLKSEQFFYEPENSPGQNKYTYSTMAYDALGNVVEFFDAGDAGSQDDVRAFIAYSSENDACEANGITGIPQSIKVEDSNGTELRRRESVLDCSTGKMTRISYFLEDGGEAVNDLEYDQYGNLTSITGPANDMGDRFNRFYAYDEAVHTYPVIIGDSYGYTSTATYDYRFGAPLITTDINGNQTDFRYDNRGRVSEIYGPYEIGGNTPTIAFEYHPEADDPYAITRHLDKYRDGDTIDTVLFVDGLKRVIQTKKDATIDTGDGNPRDGRMVSGHVKYDGLGRAAVQHYPVAEFDLPMEQFNTTVDDVVPTETYYDVVDRPVRIVMPDEGIAVREMITTYSLGQDKAGLLQFKVETTDPNGNKKASYKDVRGLITAIQEFLVDGEGNSQDLWTSYQYDALRQITVVEDAKGNQTTAEYDNFGRRVAMTNPDMGRIEKVFDLAGNLTQKITPNLRAQGKAIEYDYEFMRPTQIRYPNNPHNNVTYVYGTADMQGNGLNQVGRVVKVTHGAGSDEYAYGKLGETVQHKRTVQLGHKQPEFLTQYEYDSWGRLHKLVYPDGEVVRYSYNAGGMVTRAEGVRDGETTVYLKSMSYDKFEQRVRMEQGNGVVTNYQYEAATRRLHNLKSVRPGDNLMQNLNYTYDKVGNITQLQNQVAVNSSATMGGPETQLFEYDSLYRLTGAQGEFEYAPGKFHRYEMDMGYDEIHNITSKKQNHVLATPSKDRQQSGTSYDWEYTYGGNQPHAPSQIGNRIFSYDDNGNQTGYVTEGKGSRRTLNWDEENRLKSVADNGKTQQYVYDAGGQRVIKVRAQGTTVYVNQYYSVRNGATVSKHIFVGTSRLATMMIHGQKSGDVALSSTTTSYEGGAAANDSGATVTSTDPSANSTNNNRGKGNKKDNHPGQGLTHRSDRANEVAQNTVKNPNLNGEGPGNSGGNGNGGNSRQKSGKVSFIYYFHPDHLGSTSYVTDGDGEIYEHIGYFPFGETWYEESNNGQKVDYLFTSKEMDQETGLYYFGARYYDPRTSVWQSVDPILEEYLLTGDEGQDKNLPGMGGVQNAKNLGVYTYSHYNPVKYVDPDGRLIFMPWLIMGISSGTAMLIDYYQQQHEINTGQKTEYNPWRTVAFGLGGLAAGPYMGLMAKAGYTGGQMMVAGTMYSMGTGTLTVGVVSMMDPTVKYDPTKMLIGSMFGSVPISGSDSLRLMGALGKSSFKIGLSLPNSSSGTSNSCIIGMVCSGQGNDQTASTNTGCYAGMSCYGQSNAGSQGQPQQANQSTAPQQSNETSVDDMYGTDIAP